MDEVTPDSAACRRLPRRAGGGEERALEHLPGTHRDRLRQPVEPRPDPRLLARQG